MTFSAFWAALVRDKPQIKDPAAKIEISSAAFRRVLERAYERGREDATREALGPLDGSLPDFIGDLLHRR